MSDPVARLEQVFAAQRAAVLRDPNPSLDARLEALAALERLATSSRGAFADALAEDFGSHPAVVTDLYETGALVGRARLFMRQLPEWLSPRPVRLSTRVHGGSSAEVRVMPRGVVGNIAPWNFPVECALVMVADMLAAGNRVVIKPAPLAPASAAAVASAVREHFPEDVVAVVDPGPATSDRFPHLPWDHLTYTGSARGGRAVLRAAAENLVPVTLELGGKNPTVFPDASIDDDVLRAFLEARILKGGQVCTSPDYVLVRREVRDAWVERAAALWSAMYPRYVGHPDATSAITDAHFDRLVGYLDEARARGVEVVSLNGEEPDRGRRQVPMYVVVEPPSDLACMQDEIFGPITPVVSIDSVDEAIARINAGPSPLASYIATADVEAAVRFVRDVRSGGAGVNSFGAHAGNPAIPFGGRGASGMGCHSGYEGFLAYSHVKGVFHGASDSALTRAMRLPYGESAEQLVDTLFR